MTLRGKGFFIWKIPDCENGNPSAIASVAYDAGLTHVLIKIANGVYSNNYNFDQKIDLVPPVAQALRARGIQVYGWHYVYGNDPAGEARIAIQRMRELNLDGYVIDAEMEYKAPGKKTAAAKFMTLLRTGLPEAQVALSSFRYPSIHPQLPWREFLERCDLNMPQVYWMKANNPGAQLRRSVSEFESLTPYRPVFPTGAAFPEHGWAPTAPEVTEFMETARDMGLSGINFWSWDSTRKRMPELWELIADFQWDSSAPLPDITIQYIDALNNHNLELLLGLYMPTGVHINASRTIQGHSALKSWFGTLLNQQLPDAKFNLISFTGSGNTRHLTWTASSRSGNVYDGSDTLGLLNDKIAYHYSNFSVKRMV
jgi:hypothetical protein